MSSAITLSLVLLATTGLVSLSLSGFVALAWWAGLKRRKLGSSQLLILRFLPTLGGLLITLTVILPAFLGYEPPREHETLGPVLLLLGGLCLACLAHGMWRGWRACAATRALLSSCRPFGHGIVQNGQEVRLLRIAQPIVATIGAWRPRIVAANEVQSACSQDEFQQVVAHEIAHIRAHDNLKLLLLMSAPDLLAWTRLDVDLASRWQTAAEHEADQRAAGNDPRLRVALASALIKVARLSAGSHHTVDPLARHTLALQAAVDDVSSRVRELLAPPEPPVSSVRVLPLTVCTLLIPAVGYPFHELVHQLIEALVSFGL